MNAFAAFGNASVYAGWASFCLFLVLLAVASAIDLRERRIPNKLVVAMALVWLAPRVLLAGTAALCPLAGSGSVGSGGAVLGTGLALTPASVAAMGFPPFGVTLAGGLVGALILSGGSLAVAIAFEALVHRASMGGGDIKLLAVVGLFLGWERGLWCLFAACLVSIAAQVARRLRVGESAPVSDAFPFAPAIFVGAIVATFL